mgnify:CR=1 FL=1
MVVQHNMQAANANRMLNVTTSAQSKSTEKLSSGYRINRAADDAAGLTISEKMRKQIRGLDQASTNAQDGVSSVQTAEGALTEVHSMLQRMNELATQAANGTNSKDSDRQAIQDEIDQLTTEIDRVSETTKFNETYLLKGEAGTKTINMKAHDAGLKGTLTDNGDGTATFVMDTLNAGDKVSIGGKNYTIGATTADTDKLITDVADDATHKDITINGDTYKYIAEAGGGTDADATHAKAGYYKDGKWDDGQLTKDHTVTLNECAGVFQYAQTCFEGLKAYTTEDGRIVCFRPDLNAQRLKDSCERLEMPVFPEDRFVKAVEEVVKANAAWVPPYGSGATLYIRPYIMGTNAVIGVKPADEYQFRILVTPVGPYFKGGAKPITIRVSDFDRAAPHGTGHIKAGLNYAMSLHAIVDAHAQGFAENMYLDPATRTKVEETGGANFIFITKDGTFVTPKSDSILPSITRRSLMVVAEKYLGLKVEHREEIKCDL